MKNGDFPLLWRINRGFFASARAEAYLRLPHSLLSGVGLLGASVKPGASEMRLCSRAAAGEKSTPMS